MPQSLHKILIRGHSVKRKLNLPIGMLIEETQAAKNKLFKKFGEYFTKKLSRKITNEDLITLLF